VEIGVWRKAGLKGWGGEFRWIVPLGVGAGVLGAGVLGCCPAGVLGCWVPFKKGREIISQYTKWINNNKIGV
jgi:hypothetical protein